MRYKCSAQFACFYSGFDSKPYWQHYKCQHLIHNTWIHFSRWKGIEMKPRCSWGWAWNWWKEKDEERRDAKKEVEQKQRKEDGKEGKRNHSYWVLLNQTLKEWRDDKQWITFCSKRWGFAFAHSMKLCLRPIGAVLWTEGNVLIHTHITAHSPYLGMEFVLFHRMNRIPPWSETAQLKQPVNHQF